VDFVRPVLCGIHAGMRDATHRLADKLYQELEILAAEHREREAGRVIASMCPVCAERRKRKAEKMRRWRAKRQPK
jgi:hypothetical protein